VKFTLEIELGNDAMQTAADLQDTLLKLAQRLHKTLPYGPVRSPEGGRIMDANGNSVGTWTINPD
jgi:hypothetical protein